jgi:predicted DNA-binding transcriptional regulator AlpA
MFTEEEVAELLQVSLSKLRKWRMRKNDQAEKGPPFRKLGRLVRYPEAGLDAYVNGD